MNSITPPFPCDNSLGYAMVVKIFRFVKGVKVKKTLVNHWLDFKQGNSLDCFQSLPSVTNRMFVD